MQCFFFIALTRISSDNFKNSISTDIPRNNYENVCRSSFANFSREFYRDFSAIFSRYSTRDFSKSVFSMDFFVYYNSLRNILRNFCSIWKYFSVNSVGNTFDFFFKMSQAIHPRITQVQMVS